MNGELLTLHLTSHSRSSFRHLELLTSVAQSLSALGSTAQVILGVMLVLVGGGLLWRLRTAWTFALLLLTLTIAVTVASSARSMHLLRLAGADLVFAPAAVGSRILANLVEGNEVPTEFHDLLEGNFPGKV